MHRSKDAGALESILGNAPSNKAAVASAVSLSTICAGAAENSAPQLDDEHRSALHLEHSNSAISRQRRERTAYWRSNAKQKNVL
jgi:hypothetical protein